MRRRHRPSVAIAGAGRMAAVHGLAARALDLRTILVADPVPERAAERAAQLGARAASPAELPGGADCVVVAAPPADHAHLARAALGAGAAVLVETPLCTTLADADEVVTAARAAGDRLVYGENLVHAPAVALALDHITRLGPLVHLEARALAAPMDDRARRSASWGGGVLFEHGVHALAVVVLAAAPDTVVEVRAALERRSGLDLDDHAAVELRFASGLEATVESSWGHATPTWELQAASPEGVVRVELVPTLGVERDGEALALPAPRAAPPTPRLAQFGYLEQLAHLGAVATGRASPRPDATFGRAVLEVVCAAYTSAGRGGRAEAVPFRGPRDRTPLELWGR